MFNDDELKTGLKAAFEAGAAEMLKSVIATLREAAHAYAGFDGRETLMGAADQLESAYAEAAAKHAQEQSDAAP